MKKDILPILNVKNFTDPIYEDYDVRLCCEDEYEELKQFLKENWKEDHIFVLSKELFDFQHLNKKNRKYNLIIAKEKKTQEIHSIFAFIPTNQYDEKIKTREMLLWPCLWKSKDGVGKGLGLIHYHFLKSNFDVETLAGYGLTKVALTINKRLGMTMGKMEHYVMPNYDAEPYLAEGILSFVEKTETAQKDTLYLQPADKSCLLKESYDNPIFTFNNKYKSRDYFINRFFKHPIYDYNALVITDRKSTKAIMIVRVCAHNEHNCLRILDYAGDINFLKTVRNQLREYIKKHNYEYIDFIVTGLSEEALKDAGFFNKKEIPQAIVPNYFEPFEKRNIDLYYSYKTVLDKPKVIIFKADADQDRPNVLR